MVARFVSGKSIAGALRYNEQKVQKGKAYCIGAVGYPLGKELLNFSQKAARLENLAALNERIKVNCVHVSLNFDPSEKLGDQMLRKIADTYIRKIGFGEQPYLVYRHFDAAHPHIHIVTTNIQPDGKRIALHNIGRNQSEKARKEIEKMFRLVRAESRKSTEIYLKPIHTGKVLYGKSETKAAISNVVRDVIRNWKFTSLAQFNAILKQYNVVADNGKEGSRMREKEGLIYSILDENGVPIGIPVKASSIYSRPIVANLKKYFVSNKEKRIAYRYRLRNCIDKAVASGKVADKVDLQVHLEKENILMIYRENREGQIYGVTFLDLNAKVVFNGSDLGKAYSASNLLERIFPGAKAMKDKQQKDKQRILDMLQNIDYSKGFAAVLAWIYANGIIIRRLKNEDGAVTFFLTNLENPKENLVSADRKMTVYLLANGYSQDMETRLSEEFPTGFKVVPSIDFLEEWISGLLKSEAGYDHYSIRRKRKKKRRRSNW